MQVRVSKPVTIYIRFRSSIPRVFVLKDENGHVYYWRYLDGKIPRIKFNVPDAGLYTGNANFDIIKTNAIEIPKTFPKLPPANRDRWKPIKMVFNPDLINTTPIRIFTKEGIIEYGPDFENFIKPIQVFLTWHEKGHMFYTDEQDCDLYALVNFLRLGYNQSTAYFALTHVLRRSQENIERFKSLFNNIQKIRKQ